jgi:hypothetical protein
MFTTFFDKNDATAKAVALLENQRFDVSQAFRQFYSCSSEECEFFVKNGRPFEAKASTRLKPIGKREKGSHKMWLLLDSGTIVCHNCKQGIYFSLANSAKEIILAENPKVDDTLAWKEAKESVGIFALPLIVACKAYQMKHDPLERAVHAKLQETTLCAMTGVEMVYGQAWMVSRSFLKTIVDGSHEKQKEVAERLLREFVGRELEIGELPRFVCWEMADKLQKLFVVADKERNRHNNFVVSSAEGYIRTFLRKRENYEKWQQVQDDAYKSIVNALGDDNHHYVDDSQLTANLAELIPPSPKNDGRRHDGRAKRHDRDQSDDQNFQGKRRSREASRRNP